MQTIVFQSVSSSGATSCALNTALGIKLLWPDKKVIFLQQTKHPDVTCLGSKKVKRVGKDLWIEGVEIWDSFRNEKRDYLIIDKDRSCDAKERTMFLEKADLCVRVVRVLPAVFTNIQYIKSPEGKDEVTLLNMVRSGAQKKSIEKMNHKNISVTQVLPYEPSVFWWQSFVGIPIVCLRKSVWKDELLHFIKNNILYE